MTRYLRITRERKFGFLVPFYMIFDGQQNTSIEINKKFDETYEISNGSHTFQVYAYLPDEKRYIYSNCCTIPADTNNYHINITTEMELFTGYIYTFMYKF